MQSAATPLRALGALPMTKQGRSADRSATLDLAALFEEHHRTVFRAAYRVTGDAQDSEDVVQTVFLKLARGAAAEPLDNPAGYLHRAAVHAALDLIRKRRRRDEESIEAPGILRAVRRREAASDGAPDRDRPHTSRELRDRLRSALALLPERGAEIFALRYFEGFTNRQIADIYDTSENSIGVTLYRARGRVRELLGDLVDEGGSESDG